MTPKQLLHTRRRLEMFATEVFTPLPRSDQRVKGLTYLRGLLLDGRRKSMQPMAERLGVDHQGLQQFVTSSTWDFRAVRQRLAVRAVEVIIPRAWVIDDTGFSKDGSASPCVARQYSGTLGKVGNCQIGVSVHAVTDIASCPLNWRLYLPASWDAGQAADPHSAERVGLRRARCVIPDSERHRPKWQMAVEMLDELAGWGLAPPVVVADAGYGDNAHLRTALEMRGLAYVVQVKGAVTAHGVRARPETITYSGAEDRPGFGPLRRPLLDWVASARHLGQRRALVLHRAALEQPKSGWGGLTLYRVLKELQALPAAWTGRCPTCHQRPP